VPICSQEPLSENITIIFASPVSAYFTHFSVEYLRIFAFKIRKIYENIRRKSNSAIFWQRLSGNRKLMHEMTIPIHGYFVPEHNERNSHKNGRKTMLYTKE